MGQKRTLLLNPTNYTTEFKSLQSQRFRRRLQNGFQLFLRIWFLFIRPPIVWKGKNVVKPRHKAYKEAGRSEWKTLYRVNSLKPILFFNREFNLNSHFWNFKVPTLLKDYIFSNTCIFLQHLRSDKKLFFTNKNSIKFTIKRRQKKEKKIIWLTICNLKGPY